MPAGCRVTSPTVACFCMGETGHFQRLRPLIAGLTRRGMEAHVYTHHDFRAQVDAAGGVFHAHHGLNSTHEAIAHGVPMVSYPFFWDQPALARRCQELGLALPLARSLRGVFGVDEVQAVLGRAADDRASLRVALARASEWEHAVMGQRDAVLDRLAEIAASEPGTQNPARGGSPGPRRGRQR